MALLLLLLVLGQPPIEGHVLTKGAYSYYFSVRRDDGRVQQFGNYLAGWRMGPDVIPGMSDRVKAGARVKVEVINNQVIVTVLDNFDDTPFGKAQDVFLAEVAGPRSLGRLDRACLAGLGASRYATRQITQDKVARERRTSVVYRGLKSPDPEVRNRAETILWGWTEGLGQHQADEKILWQDGSD